MQEWHLALCCGNNEKWSKQIFNHLINYRWESINGGGVSDVNSLAFCE